MTHLNREDDEAQKTPSLNRHKEESAGSSAHPTRHKLARSFRSSKQLDRSARSSRGPNDKTACIEEELNEMKKQMRDMKNNMKAKAARNLDNLVHRADSPFIPRIANFPLSTRFKVLPLENFDRSKDPFNKIQMFYNIIFMLIRDFSQKSSILIRVKSLSIERVRMHDSTITIYLLIFLILNSLKEDNALKTMVQMSC
jgi:hypothetical protein